MEKTFLLHVCITYYSSKICKLFIVPIKNQNNKFAKHKCALFDVKRIYYLYKIDILANYILFAPRIGYS